MIAREPVLTSAAVMTVVQLVIVWLVDASRIETVWPYLLTVGNIGMGAFVARLQVKPEEREG